MLEDVAPQGSGEYVKREVMVSAGGVQFSCLVYEIQSDRIAGRTVIPGGDWFARR